MSRSEAVLTCPHHDQITTLTSGCASQVGSGRRSPGGSIWIPQIACARERTIPKLERAIGSGGIECIDGPSKRDKTLHPRDELASVGGMPVGNDELDFCLLDPHLRDLLKHS